MRTLLPALAVIATLALAGCQDDKVAGPENAAQAKPTKSAGQKESAKPSTDHCLDPIAAGQLGVDSPKAKDPSEFVGTDDRDSGDDRGPFDQQAALDTDLYPGLRVTVSTPKRFEPSSDAALSNIDTGEYRQEYGQHRVGCPAYAFDIDVLNPTDDEEQICRSSFTIWDGHEEAMYSVEVPNGNTLGDCVDIAPGASASFRLGFVAKDAGPFAVVVWRGGTHVFGDNATGDGSAGSDAQADERQVDSDSITDPSEFAEAYFQAWKVADEATLLAMTKDRFDVDSFPMRYPLSDSSKMTCEKTPGGSLMCDVLTGAGKATLVMYVAPATPTYDKWHIDSFTLGSAN